MKDKKTHIRGIIFTLLGEICWGFSGACGQFLFMSQGVSDIGAVKASMLASAEPVPAAILSVVWLKTEFMFIDIIGFACIMITVFLLSKTDEE